MLRTAPTLGILGTIMDYYESFSPKLRMWYVEANNEKNIQVTNKISCYDYALYPQSFYKRISSFDHTKCIDYCFVGAFKIDSATEHNRSWILDFIRRNFTEKSYLQFTDRDTKRNYKKVGVFDFTIEKEGFVPKEVPKHERNRFDENYFSVMCKSQFTLCPAGDTFWSMRFYEALMCRSIPVVSNVNETFRSKAESKLDYKYYLRDDDIAYREDWADHNYEVFTKYHNVEYA